MLAFSLDNLLFFLLIAIAALFQLLSKTISKAKKNDSNETPGEPRPQTPRPIQRAPRESDADRIRKFLEALGQPPSSTPPSPVLPRSDIPPRRLAPVQPPALTRVWRLPRKRGEKPDISEREITPIEQPSGFQQIVPPPVPLAATTAFEVDEALPIELQQQPTPKPPTEAYAGPKAFGVAERGDFKMNIPALLASKSGLRNAMILREIFGSPRSLQTLDETL
jgi:hypothetical protein